MKIEFPLVAKSHGAMHFDGMSFHPKGDAVTVFLAIKGKDGIFARRRSRTSA